MKKETQNIFPGQALEKQLTKAMNKILFFLLIALYANVSTAQSWIIQNSNFITQFNYPSIIDVKSPTVTWAAATANGGTNSQQFTKTTDGGNTWHSGTVTSDFELGFSGISAIDANTAYALCIMRSQE